MAFRTITGEAGQAWTNDTSRVYWQLHVQFKNSCGLCIQYANAIAPYFPLPFHPGCNCTQTPVRPGQTAKPFVDFQAELAQLPHSQQVAAVGASNWRLIEAGKVEWKDVVTPGRIRTFREVVRRNDLTADDLKRAGIRKDVVDRAFAALNSPENEAAKAQQKTIAAALKGLGVSDDRIKRELTGNLAGRVLVTPIGNRPPSPPAAPAAPPVPPVAPQPAPVRPKPLAPQAKPQPVPVRLPVATLPEKPKPPAPNIAPVVPSASWIKRAVESFNRFVEAIRAKAKRKTRS